MSRRSAISFPAPHEAAARYGPGDVISERYQLVRLLGEGGMGIVWVAHSIPLDIDVALKVIAADLAGTAAAERMAQEARAAARLGHPAMVRVMDFGKTQHGDPYLVMELLHGEMMSDIIERQGRLSAVEAVRMLLPIADGLATAHDAGIVHRDLKPDNVFLARDAVGRMQPKLLDFGIAKLQDTELDRKITAMGSLVGSPDYMSPEQAEGREDIDHRSDVWGFCVVLYEAITGQVPFTADNYNGLMFAIINDDPPPTTTLGAGDSDLWRVLSRGLSKFREERWASMWELGEALALWAYEQGVKDDITSRSIKVSWLDAGLSGVKVLVSQTIPPERPTDPVAVEAPSFVGETRALEATPPPVSRTSRALWPLIAAVALLATAGLLFAARSRPDALPAVAALLDRVGLLPAPEAESSLPGPSTRPAEGSMPAETAHSAIVERPPAEASTSATLPEHNERQAPPPGSQEPPSAPPAPASAAPAPSPNAPQSPKRQASKRPRDFGF